MNKCSFILISKTSAIKPLLLAFLLLAGLGTHGQQDSIRKSRTLTVKKNKNDTNYVAQEFYIKLKDNILVPQTAIVNIATELPFVQKFQPKIALSSAKRPFFGVANFNSKLQNVYHVKLQKKEDNQQFMEQVKKEASVEYIERVPKYRVSTAPNDPILSGQWYLEKISAQAMWNLPIGTNEVIVAVVDNAIQTNHPDLSANMLPGWDISDNDSDPTPPNSDFYHGTHVSGLVAAVTNNGIGIASLGQNKIKVMPVKVTHNTSDYSTIEEGLEGILWAANNGAKVINCSWGGSGYSQTWQTAINDVYAMGIIIVCAAGNDGINAVSYPAGYEHIISVASSDSNNKRSYFSRFGPWIDITAPGSGILSTMPFDDYGNLDGTSMASPIVASLVAYILSVNPTLDNEQVEFLLKATAENVGVNGNMGAGRINAYKAIMAAQCATIGNFTISANGPTIFCDTKSVELTAPAGTDTYQWYRDGQKLFIHNNSISVNTTGVYNVIKTDINGCLSISNAIQVIANPIKVLTVAPLPELCSGNVYDLRQAVVPRPRLNNFVLSYWHDKFSITPAAHPESITDRGIYYVKADSMGCSETQAISVSIPMASQPLVQARQMSTSQASLLSNDPVSTGSEGFGYSTTNWFIISADGTTGYSTFFGMEVEINSLVVPSGVLHFGTPLSEPWEDELSSYLSKRDNNGNTIWEKKGNVPVLPQSALETDDGGFIIISVNNLTRITKIDNTGEVIWNKSYPKSFVNKSIITLKDGNFLLAGTAIDATLFRNTFVYKLLKYDQSGNLIWDKSLQIGDGNLTILNSVFEDQEGNFYVAGCDQSTRYEVLALNKGRFDIWIVKTDALGNKIWAKQFGGLADEIKPVMLNTKTGIIIAACSDSDISGDITLSPWGRMDLWVFKIDYSGNIIWQKRYGTAKDEFTVDIKETENGFLLCENDYWDSYVQSLPNTGNISTNFSEPLEGVVLSLDSLGNRIWDIRLSSPSFNGVSVFGNMNYTHKGELLLTSSSFGYSFLTTLRLGTPFNNPACGFSNNLVLTVPNCAGKVMWSNGYTGSHLVVGANPAQYTATCARRNCTSTTSLPFYVNSFTPEISYNADCISPGASIQLTAQNCTSTPVWSTGQNTSVITLSNIREPRTISLSCTNNGCTNGTKIINLAPIVNVSNTESAGTKKIYGNNYLNSIGKIVPSAKISYVAGKAITLNPGFTAGSGTVFQAYTGGCNN